MSLDFPSSPVNGQTYNNYVWDSSVGAWLAQGSTNNVGDQIAGLQAKFPVSVANGGTGATTVETARDNLGVGLVLLGATTFSAAASFSFQSVFSAKFDSYRVVIDAFSSAAANLFLRFRNGAAIDSAANYNNQYLISSSTTVTGGVATGGSAFNVGGIEPNTTYGGAYSLDIYGPYLAEVTRVESRYGYYNPPIVGNNSGNHVNAASFDGVVFLPSTGTFTGRASVYGYAKG